MTVRKFRVGQKVTYRLSSHRKDALDGAYQIIRFLPQRQDARLEYQIRNLDKGLERVAKESELRSRILGTEGRS
jgi:hypothetical protein